MIMESDLHEGDIVYYVVPEYDGLGNRIGTKLMDSLVLELDIIRPEVREIEGFVTKAKLLIENGTGFVEAGIPEHRFRLPNNISTLFI